MIRVQQSTDIHETAGGGRETCVQCVRRSFAGPFRQGAAEFGGMIVSDQGIETGIQRILAALILIEAVENYAFTNPVGRDHHRLELAELDHGHWR